jgi:photosystem II stability/assembly factor-like uncharacterized protein
VIAWVATKDGVLEVDVENEVVVGGADVDVQRERPDLGIPRLLAAATAAVTVVALVDRRPPLLVSHDSGETWSEAGSGLPPGFDVAVDPDDPDRILYAARNRLYLSTDGGTFWQALIPELPDIQAVAWSTAR